MLSNIKHSKNLQYMVCGRDEESIEFVILEIKKKYNVGGEFVLRIKDNKILEESIEKTRYPALDGSYWLRVIYINDTSTNKKEEINKIIKEMQRPKDCTITLYVTLNYGMYLALNKNKEYEILRKNALTEVMLYRLTMADIYYIEELLLGGKKEPESKRLYLYKNYNTTLPKIVKYYQLRKQGQEIEENQIEDYLGLGNLKPQDLVLKILRGQPITERKYKNREKDYINAVRLLSKEYSLISIQGKMQEYLKTLIDIKQLYLRGKYTDIPSMNDINENIYDVKQINSIKIGNEICKEYSLYQLLYLLHLVEDIKRYSKEYANNGAMIMLILQRVYWRYINHIYDTSNLISRKKGG